VRQRRHPLCVAPSLENPNLPECVNPDPNVDYITACCSRPGCPRAELRHKLVIEEREADMYFHGNPNCWGGYCTDPRCDVGYGFLVDCAATNPKEADEADEAEDF